MSVVLDQILADLKAEGDQLWSTVAGLDEDGWRTPTPATGWDVATQVAHLLWTDEVAVLAATDKAAWDDVVVAAMEDPDGFVDAGAREIARLAPQGAAGAVGRRARGAGAHPAGVSLRRADAVVRAADVPGVDGHRPVHGDLGPRARRVRRPRRQLRAHRPHPPRRPPRRAHPRLRVRHQRPRAAGRGVPRRADRPLRRAVGLGARGRRAARDRSGLRLLPAGHPAGAPRRRRPRRP